MKIALCNPNYFPKVGGIETSLYEISKELSKLNITTTIYTSTEYKKIDNRKEYSNIICIKIKKCKKILLPFQPIIEYYQYKKFFQNEFKYHNQYDCVICRNAIMGFALIKLNMNINIIYIPPAILFFDKIHLFQLTGIINFFKSLIAYCKHFFETRMQKELLKKSEVIVFSNNVKNQILNWMPDFKKNIYIIYPGVGSSFQNYLYNKKNMVDDKIRYLFVGRLVEEKNLLMLIKAFYKLMLVKKNVELLIVGDGEYKIELQKFCKNHNLEDYVKFFGFSHFVIEYYLSSHFFVLPSKYESFGQVIIEALSTGTPVIGFPTFQGKTLTALQELIIDGKTGFLCQSFSIDALYSQMLMAYNIAQEDKYDIMSKTCYDVAKRTYSWENFVKSILNVAKNFA